MYDVNYFIEKFEAIPEIKWTTGVFYDPQGRYCAVGHCGGGIESLQNELPEVKALHSLLGGCNIVFDINDGGHFEYQQTTPKQRILAALHDIKKMQGTETHPDQTSEFTNLVPVVSETPDKILKPQTVNN